MMVTGCHVSTGDGMKWKQVTDVSLNLASRFNNHFRKNSLNKLSRNLKGGEDGYKGQERVNILIKSTYISL
jgi:hypothetical protein